MLRYCQPTRDLDPVEMLLAAVVKRAIRDAQQGCNEGLREEALCWLWTVVPVVARMVELPAVGADNAMKPPLNGHYQ